MALSAAVLALAAVTVLRARRARRGWPLADVAGAHVRVSPRVGPAVLGIVRPEVVVPEWLLEAPAEEQRLVVLHEREHVRARDPLVLAAGCLAVALCRGARPRGGCCGGCAPPWSWTATRAC